MCGRFTLNASAEDLAHFFGLDLWPASAPQFNISPSHPILAVRASPDPGQAGRPHEVLYLRWGLIPSWSKDPDGGAGLINARSETAATKPSFRAAFRRRRCLIPATGFYEWKKTERRKEPYLFQLGSGQPFAMAGLWDQWSDPAGTFLESCAILTTAPNELTARIHDRMPVILPPEAFPLWLDPAVQDPERVRPLLVPFPAGRMSCHPVGTYVNDPAHQGAECVAEAPAASGLPPGKARPKPEQGLLF